MLRTTISPNDMGPVRSNRMALRTLLQAIGVALLIAVGPATCVIYIVSYTLTATSHDDFSFIVPCYEQWQNGTLSWSDFYAPWFEHQVFFARAVALPFGLLTRHSTWAFLFLDVAIFAGIALLLYLEFQRTLPRSGKRSLALAFVPVALMLFSLRQIEMFQDNMMISEMMGLSGAVLTFYLLSAVERPGLRFLLAICSATIASGSQASGLLAWPVGFLYLLFSAWCRGRNVGRASAATCLALWSVAGALVWWAYLVSEPHLLHSSVSHVTYPLESLRFLVTLAGAPFSIHLGVAALVGVLLLGTYPVALRALAQDAKVRGYATIAFPLIVFSLLNLIVLLFGRVQKGMGAALWSRDAPFTLLGVIGLYLALTMLASGRRSWSIARHVLAVLIVLGVGTATWDAFAHGREHRERCLQDAYYLRTYRDQPEQILAELFHPRKIPTSGKIVREGASILDTMGLSVFAEPPEQLPPGPPTEAPQRFAVSIDIVNGQELDARNARLAATEATCEIVGHVVATPDGSQLRSLFLETEGFRFQTVHGLSHPSATMFSPSPLADASGFYASFAVGLLGQGRHHVAVVVVGADGTSYHSPR